MGVGETVRCPLANWMEYLGFPKMTGQRMSEDQGLGHTGPFLGQEGEEHGHRLREGSLQVPRTDAERGSG